MRRRKALALLLTRRHTSSAAGFAPPPAAPPRRVVVTGIGLVTPLGVGTRLSWRSLLAGGSGVRLLSAADLPGPLGGEDMLQALPVRHAGLVPRGSGAGQLDWARWSESGRHAPFAAFALAAAHEALRDAQLQPSERQRERVGVSLGCAMGAVGELAQAGALLHQRLPRRLSPHLVPRVLASTAAGAVSQAHGLRGPLCCAATACASGASALADALAAIRSGQADAMLAGGTEAVADAVALAGFARARALAHMPACGDPRLACRPFDAQRSGFVLAEGAAVMVLEELSHAVARGAACYAELRSVGLSADAFHATAPPSDGRGALLAMRSALAVAGLSPADVGYLNAHATGTQLGDSAEAFAVAALCAGHGGETRVSSSKGATGHLLGAAGALEATFAALALAEGVLPGTRNLREPDAAGLGLARGQRVSLLAGEAQAAPELRCALSNSFGFGGANASVCLTQPPDEALRRDAVGAEDE